MKNYRVTVSISDTFGADVKASNEDEAIEKAKEEVIKNHNLNPKYAYLEAEINYCWED